MQDKVELGLFPNLARPLGRLHRLGPELGEEEEQAWVVIVWIADSRKRVVYAGLEVLERGLQVERDRE